jgi:hypothetical protein
VVPSTPFSSQPRAVTCVVGWSRTLARRRPPEKNPARELVRPLHRDRIPLIPGIRSRFKPRFRRGHTVICYRRPQSVFTSGPGGLQQEYRLEKLRDDGLNPCRPTMQLQLHTGDLLKLEEPTNYKSDYSAFYPGSARARMPLNWLVGAGRFERPTPCAQGIGTRDA